MSFLDFLPGGSEFIPLLARKTVRTISRPPSWADMKQVRPRADSELVRAWRAERSGELATGHGELKYLAGRDWIVQHGPHEFSVVRGDIFERLYRRVEADRYAKRTDVVLRYFTMPHRVRVRTLEGIQYADAGDWIMQGVKGELWPVKPDKARAKYEPID